MAVYPSFRCACITGVHGHFRTSSAAKESKDLCAFLPEGLEVLKRREGGEASRRWLLADWLNGWCNFLLPGFGLACRRELDSFPKDGVPRWVEFRVNMEAPPATRVVILSPPH